LSGEIKGKALAKVNQQAFEEYNDSALVACPYCTRWVLQYYPQTGNHPNEKCSNTNLKALIKI
jgi:hypothetical protein